MVFEILKGAISLNGDYLFFKKITWYFQYLFSNILIFLKMLKKAKSKGINMIKKCNKWYIKTDSKLLICWLFLNALLLELFNCEFIITFVFLKTDHAQGLIVKSWDIVALICFINSANTIIMTICEIKQTKQSSEPSGLYNSVTLWNVFIKFSDDM